MQQTESLEEFYRHKFNSLPDTMPSNIGQANVFRLEDCLAPDARPIQYS